MGSGAFGINLVDERVIYAVKQKYPGQYLKLKEQIIQFIVSIVNAIPLDSVGFQ